MATKTYPIEGQNQLFALSPQDGEHPSQTITPWQELENPEPVSEIGPHITREERAIHLIWALNALAHRNMLIGIDSASNDPGAAEALRERYREATPLVIEHSTSKAERLLEEAKLSFWHATGYTALSGAGVFTNGQVRTRHNKFWRDFTGRYGDCENHDNLVIIRNKERKLLPKDHYLQKVKGWRVERKKQIRRARVTSHSARPQELTYPVMSGNRMPARSPEIDAINSGHMREILAKFNTTKPGDN